MNAAVSPERGRRQGARKEHPRQWAVTDEQRGRRPLSGETLRAEVLLALFFVAPQLQTAAGMRLRRSANKTKIPLSGSVHSFLTGC